MKRSKRSVDYSRWGYIFIIPFFIIYFIFSFIPLFDTFRFSFFEYFSSGLRQIGPNFVGLDNYKALLDSDMLRYAGNTMVLWSLGFIPQIVVAMLLALWFTDKRTKITGLQFFKVVMYLPNLIMASAFAMMFFALFSTNGPVNSILINLGWITDKIDFLGTPFGTRAMIAFMNFLMWFGNTAILLMAAIMGINEEIFESADIDGATPFQKFFQITLPLIRPILTYTLITSIIGGLQMFDVPQILTNGQGSPNRTSMTLIMFLNSHLKSRNYGMAGALSVYLFIVSGILCYFVYKMLEERDPTGMMREKAKRSRKKGVKTNEI